MQQQTTPELRVGAVVISPAGTRYTITGVLGSGGFGITYSARVDEMCHGVRRVRRVALKEHFVRSMCGRNTETQAIDVYAHNTGTFNRTLRDFIGEARRLKMIAAHPAIVTVSEVFTANNTAYYAMDLIEGASLAEIVTQRGALSEAETIALIRPVIDAVATLHSQRVTHLDIKPGNIMIDRRSGRPVLIDFGLSKHYKEDGSPTSTINTQGVSAGYAPPEQYAGITKFSPASDVYALAATIFFCLTGKVLPRSIDIRPGDVDNKIPATLSANIRFLLQSSLAFLADDRLPDGGAMLDVICGRNVGCGTSVGVDNNLDLLENETEILEEYPVTASSDGDKSLSNTAKRKRRRWLVILLASVGVMIGGIMGWYIMNRHPQNSNQHVALPTPSDTVTSTSIAADTVSHNFAKDPIVIDPSPKEIATTAVDTIPKKVSPPNPGTSQTNKMPEEKKPRASSGPTPAGVVRKEKIKVATPVQDITTNKRGTPVTGEKNSNTTPTYTGPRQSLAIPPDR